MTPIEEEDDGDDDSDPVQGSTPAAVLYQLTVTTDEGGTVTSFLGVNSFSAGTTVSLTPEADDGYVFTGWDGDVTDDVVTMNVTKSVHANFELIDQPEEELQEADPLPETLPGDSDDNIFDSELPEGLPEMPQTSGIPMEIFFLGGSSLLGLGLKLKRRR
jgi:uncharacterized repeat protein (TIGR02543 family)